MRKEMYPVLRGALLRILYAAHPDYMGLPEIQQCLDDQRCTASRETIRSECDYLQYKIGGHPLVVWKDQSLPGSDAKLFCAKITADGIDLIERRFSLPDEDQNWIRL